MSDEPSAVDRFDAAMTYLYWAVWAVSIGAYCYVAFPGVRYKLKGLASNLVYVYRRGLWLSRLSSMPPWEREARVVRGQIPEEAEEVPWQPPALPE